MLNMHKDKLDILFKRLEGGFDTEDTPKGHQERFMARLNENQTATRKSNFGWWKPLSIAATIVLLITLGLTKGDATPESADLASVSPEMEQTQSFFTTTINEELETLKALHSPQTQNLVDDTMAQLNALEVEYDQLKVDLVESGNDRRVIYAMISNLQNRVDLLQEVIATIEEIKNFKSNENETTI